MRPHYLDFGIRNSEFSLALSLLYKSINDKLALVYNHRLNGDLRVCLSSKQTSIRPLKK